MRDIATVQHPRLSFLLSASKLTVMAHSTATLATTILLLFASSTFARVVNYNLNIANGQVSPDGVTRNAVLGKSYLD